MYKWWRRALGYMVFLPNAMPLSALLKTEIFPWALLFSINKEMRLSRSFLFFATYLVLSTLLLGNLSQPIVPIRSLLAILNATLVFFAMQHLNQEAKGQVVKAVLVLMVVQVLVACLQVLQLFPALLVEPIRFFIERFRPDAYGFGRGVTGLFAEPSYLGLAIHYFVAFLFFYKRIAFNSVGGILLLMGLLGVNLLLTRSVTGLLFFVLMVLAMPQPKRLLRVLPWIGLGVFGLLAVLPLIGELPRALQFLFLFKQAWQAGDSWMFLLQESGLRLVGIMSAYWYGIITPWGAGMGNWGPASLQAMAQLGLSTTDIEILLLTSDNFTGIRPTSFAAALFLETGWLGFALFAWAVNPYFPWRAGWKDAGLRPLLVLFLFNTFFLGAVGDPIPWAIMGLSLLIWRERNNSITSTTQSSVANTQVT
ncbi:MAG: hypothetical protein C0424_11980 [Sphingobacteriaceae bacterium]|nr:hypothetical protein [Sphingobacteriaceae bacterium]